MPIVYDPAPVFLGLDGLPLNGGWVGFFEDGTDTPKAVYSDSSLGTPVANPQVLGADGRMPTGTGVWYGIGKYRVRLYDSLGAEVWTRDGIDGEVVTVAGLVTSQVVESISVMVNDLFPGAYGLVHCLGYYSEGDGGGGFFRWVAGMSTTPNQGTIFQPTVGGNGRWVRLPSTEVDARWFGATSASSTCATFLGKARDWCIQEGIPLHIVGGDYDLGGNVGFTADLHLIIEEGVVFGSSTTASTVTIACDADIRSISSLIGVGADLEVTSAIDCKPEWWGVTGATGETVAWAAFSAGRGTGRSYLTGQYECDGGSPGFGPLHFGPGAQLTLSASVSCDTITYDVAGTWLIKINTSSNSLEVDQNELEAWIFYGLEATVDPTYYARVVKNLTDTGTKKVTLVWNYLPQYDISSSPADYDWVSNRIEAGTIIGGTIFAFGQVIAGNHRVFDPDMTQVILSQPAPLEWWGAIQNDSSSDAVNMAALEKAVICTPLIDGLGSNSNYRQAPSGGFGYYITGSALVTNLHARDLCLRTSGTAAVEIANTGTLRLNSCTMIACIAQSNNKATEMCIVDNLVSGNLILKAGQFRIENSDFTGTVELVNDTAEAVAMIENSKFGGLTLDGTFAAFSGSVSDNRIYGSSSEDLTISYPDRMTITGNQGAGNNSLSVSNADQCTISNNVFRDISIGSANYCAIIGNVTTSTTARNSWSGTGCTVLGNNTVYRAGAGDYSGFDATTLPAVANLNLYNV